MNEKNLEQNNYPEEPNSPSYFMMRIRKPADIGQELQGVKLDIRNIPVLYWGKRNMPIFLVKLKDLIRKE